METVTKRTQARIMQILAWIFTRFSMIVSRLSFFDRLSFVVLRTTNNEQRTTNNGIRRIYSVLFACALLLGSVQVWGQTTYSWRSEGSSNNWSTTNSWWNGTANQIPQGNEILVFNNNNRTTNSNNLSNTSRHKITFQSGATTARTISGSNNNTFFEFGTTWPWVRNEASNTLHSIGFPIAASTNNGFNLELIAQAGPLAFTGTINTNGRMLQVYGNNSAVDGTNRYIRLGGVTSGTGGVNVSQFGVVRLNAAHTYTGETQIDNGELWIESSGSIASGSNVFLGNGGQLANVAKFWLSNASGGTSTSKVINVNAGNYATRIIGGLNTSNTHTFSGNIVATNATHLTISAVSAGGTTSFTGVISGVSTQLDIEGSGTVSLGAANTYTGKTYITGSTLTLAAANALPVGSNAGIIQTAGAGTRTINLGAFNLGTSTSSANSAGALDFDANTTINLASSGSYNYYFKSSGSESWAATTITINNWSGIPNVTGSGNKIFIGSSANLSAGQLAKITFTGYTGCTQLSTGEIVPTGGLNPGFETTPPSSNGWTFQSDASTVFNTINTSARSGSIRLICDKTNTGARNASHTSGYSVTIPSAGTNYIHVIGYIGVNNTASSSARVQALTNTSGATSVLGGAASAPNVAYTRFTTSGLATNNAVYYPSFQLSGSTSSLRTYSMDDIIIYTSTSSSVDLTKPNAPSGLAVTRSGGNNNLAWSDGTDNATNTSGIEGTLILRASGNRTSSITALSNALLDQAYYSTSSSVGPTTISDGTNTWTVLSNGTSSGSFSDAGAGTNFTYAVFMRDKAFNYSSGVVSYMPAPPTINSTSGVVASSPGSGTSGYVGNTITINGTNLDLVTEVRVGGSGGTVVSIASQSATSLTFTAINAGGQIYVSNLAGNTTSTETYTNLGFISNAATDWNTASTWLGGAVPAASSAVTIAHAVTVNGAVSAAPSSVTINSTRSLTFGASGTLTSTSVTNNGSLVMTAGGTLTIASGGTLANGTSTFTSGSGTVSFAGSGTITGTITFNNIHLNGTVTFSNTVTVNGTLRINANGAVSSQAPRYGASSILEYNTGGNYGRSTEWNATGNGTIGTTQGYPNNINLTGNTTLNFPNAEVAVSRGIEGNLTINSGSSLYMDFGTPDPGVSASLTVRGNVTQNGNLSLGNANGGDLYIGGNYTEAASGFSNNFRGRAVIFNGTGTQVLTKTGGGTISFAGTGAGGYFIVDKTGGSVQLNSSTATSVSVTQNAGDVLQIKNTGSLDLNGQTFTLSGAGGNILTEGGTRNITSTTSGARFVISGDKTVRTTSSGTLVFGSNVTVGLSSIVNFGAGLSTVNGTLEINSGGGVTTNAPVYGSSSLLKYNFGGVYGRNIEWSASSGSVGSTVGYPNDVQVSNNTTLDYPNTGTAAFSTNLFVGRDLTIDAGSSLYMDYGSAPTGNKSSRLTVARHVNNAGNLSLGDAVLGDIYVGGNWTRTGTVGSFNPNSRAVFFNGAGDQTITRTGGSGISTFDFLNVDKSSGNLIIANNITCNRTLTLTSGDVVTGSNKVTISSTGDITVGTATSHIVGNLERHVATGSNVARLFPIGDGSNYSPATITLGSVTTAGTITLRTDNSNPYTATYGLSSSKYINRYWTPTNATTVFTGASIQFNYVTGDLAGSAVAGNIRAAGYNGTAWIYPSTTPAANQFTITGITNATIANYYTGGECGTSSFTPSSNTPLCVGATLNLLSGTVSGGAGSYTYSWSGPNGFSSTSQNPSRTNVQTADAGTYTLTVSDAAGCSSSGNATVTVTTPPNAGTISGTQGICVSGTTTFTSNGNSGGAWSTSNAGIANVNSSTGVVTGVAAGSATITYTVTGTGGCSNATATRTVTVTAAPNAGTLSGTQAICVGGSTTFTSNGNSGGAWTTSNAGIANVNSSTGVVTGVAGGTATITYTVTGTGGCSNATSTRTVTVTASPNAGTLSGTQSVCVGSTTTFSSDGGAGSWTSSNTGIATVNSSTGVVTGVAVGTATITYTVTGTGGCSNATATRTVTVTALPSAPTAAGLQTFCNGATVADLVASGTAIKWYTTATGGSEVSSSTALATQYYYASQTVSSCESNTRAAVSVIINASPSAIDATVNNATTCEGAAVNLSSTAATFNSTTAVTLLSENFNGTINGWTTVNNSTGGTAADAAWKLRPNAYQYIESNGVVNNFNSNDNTQFYMSNSDDQGSGGTTETMLQSPAFSTVGLSAASLSFFHFFEKTNTGSDIGRVEVSTNGSSWTEVRSYTTDQGNRTGSDPYNYTLTQATAVNLNSYVNNPTVYVRFRYNGAYSYWWVIDNVSVTGTSNRGTGYAWTSSPAGFTASTQNTSASPTVTTTYTVTATNHFGCTSTDNVTVTVIPNNTITLSSAVGTNAQTVCNNTAISNITYTTTGASGATFSGLPAGVTGLWSNNVVTISGTPTATGTFNYTVTLTGGCGNITANGSITVNAANAITLSSAVGTNAQSVCKDVAITNITYNTTTATGATFSGLPAGVSGIWSSNVVTISGIPSVVGTYNYTVTLTGGCTVVTATGSITVRAVPVAYTVTGGGAFCSGEGGNVVGLANSESGVNYQLVRDGATNVGSPVAGTGSAISFGAQTTAGIYTVVGTRTSTNCSVGMSNAVSIAVTSLPNAPTIASITQPTCTVATATINLSGLPTGNWTVIRYPGAVATTGSGSTASFDNLAANITYTFTVTPTGGCTSAASANAVVNAQPTTPAAPTAGNNSRCGTGTVAITASVAEGVTVDWYSLSSGGTILSGGTGTTSFTTPSIASTTSYYAQSRSVSGGCLSNTRTEVVATVNPLPTITASATATSVSYGTASSSLSYTAVTNNPTTYSITWNSSPSNSFAAVTNQTIPVSPISITIPTGTNAGTYTGNLTVTNGLGCTSTNRTFTLTVNTVPLTITGISAADKVYDGNSAATLTGTPAYVGLISGETFSVNGTGSASFSNANVGANKTVTITGYTVPSSNYTITQPSLTASITPAPLTITADEKTKSTGSTMSTPQNGSIEFTAEGLIGTETVGTVTLTITNGFQSGAAAGVYTDVVVPSNAGGGTFNPANYSITYVPADLIVGTTIYSRNGGGNWNSTNTWSLSSGSGQTGGSSCGCIPGPTDNVIIRGEHTVTVNVTNAACARLELGGSSKDTYGVLAFSSTGSPKLTVAGQVVVGGSGSTSTNRRGEVDLIGGATLEVEELVLTRSTSGDDAPAIFDMTGGGTLIAGTISVGQGTVTWTPSTGTVVMKSTSTLPSASSVASFNNLTINADVTTTSGRNFSVAGNFTVNGTFVPGNAAHVFSGAGTLTGNGVVDVTLVSTTALTSQYTITNRTLTNLTVEYVGSGNQSMLGTTYGGLVTGGSGTKTMLDNITVNNDVLIGAGTTVSAGSNRTLSVRRNFTNNGTFSPASGTVTLSGSGAQTVSGTSSFFNFTVSNSPANITLANGSVTRISNTFNPGGTSFGNVTGSTIDFNGSNQNIPEFTFFDLAINGGGTKTLQGPVTVTDQLILTSGLLSLDDNDLFITPGTTNAISGGGNGSYIVTGNDAKLKYTIGGAGTYTMPVGSSSVYNPMELNWSSAPGITRLDVQYIPSTASTGTGLPTNVFGCQSGAELLTNGYWNVSAQGTLSSTPTLSLTRRGHGNAGERRSSHGIVRRNNPESDWFVAGVWTDNGIAEITPSTTGPVLMEQEQLDAFGEIAIAKGTGNSSIGIWTGALNGNAENSANWGCNTVPTSAVDVVIPRNVRNNPSIINGDIAARNFTIQDGARLIMAGSRSITLSNTGVFTNNGTFDGANTGAVTFQGTGTIAGTSATTFNNVVLNGAVTLTTVPTINGNLQMNDNASVSAAPNYGSNAVLVYNNTNSSSTGNEWSGNGATRTAGLPNIVRLSGSGTISLSGNRSVPETLELNGGTLDLGSNTLSLYDELSISGGAFNTSAAGTVSYASTSAGQTIVATNYPSLSFSNFDKTLPSSGTIGIAGAFTPGTGTHTTTGSTISFNGSLAQSIPAFNYNNVIVAGSDTKTAAAGLTIPGNLTISSTFDAGAFSHAVAGNWINNGTFTHGGGTVQFNGTTAISGSSENTFNNVLITGALTAPNANMNVAGNWTINGGTFTPGTGTVTLNNTQAPQTMGGSANAFSFNNLTIANAGQTITLQGSPNPRKSLNVAGNLTLSSGTFSTIFTDVNMSGGNWTNNGATFTSGGSKVIFNGTSGNQAINGTASTQTFARLEMNKPGRTLSLGGSTTRLNVTDTFALVAGTYDAGTTDSLKIGKNWVITGGTFSAGTSTVAFDGDVAQDVPALTYHKLSIQGSGKKSAMGNLTLNDELNIANGKELDLGTHRLIDGGSLNTTGSGTLRTKNTGTAPLPNGKTWSFGVSFEGADVQTVSNGTYNGGVTINNSGNGANMNGNVTAASVTLNSGDLSIQSNTLTLNGAFNGSSNNALRGSATSNLTVGNGAAAGILYFRNDGTFNSIKDLRFMSSASATLGNRLNVTAGAAAGKVKVEANSSLASNGNLVLKSDTLGTAFVDEIANCTTCTPITGEVEVERAMPNRRTWRLVTIPVTGNYTLRQQLTRQGPGAAVEYPAPYCNGSAAPAASGYGTMITAHSMSSCANAAAVGADLITTGGSSSVRRYTHINNTGSWASNNTTNVINFSAVPDQDGYMMFIRGDRSQLGSGSNATTLRFKGTLKQGNAVSTQSVNASYGVMSNPYAAPINIDDVFNNGTGNANKFDRNVWVWDGEKVGANGLGGYRSLSYDGVSAYTCGDCGTNAEGQQFLTLNTGQAFMVQRKADVTTAVSMTVKEEDKVSSAGNIATMRTSANARLTNSTVPSFRVQMHRANGASLESFADAATARFNKLYQANANEPYDVYKYNNNDENISLVRDRKYLVIESRPVPTTTDTLYLPFWNATNRGYALSIQTENFSTPGLAAELIDSFTNTRTQVPLNGSTLVYPFSVTTNAASKSLSRFRVVFTQGSSLPVNFVNVRAQVKNGSMVQVDWEVANEENLYQYEVERSADGKEFTKMAEQTPRNVATNHTYSWMDVRPNAGNNFYRIKALDNDGTFRYSATVKVNTGGAVQDVRVYPTTLDQPTVSLELTDQPAGIYEISMSNALGQMIFNRNIQHTGGNAVMTVDLSSYTLTAGVHFFCIKDQDGNKKSVKLMVKK